MNVSLSFLMMSKSMSASAGPTTPGAHLIPMLTSPKESEKIGKIKRTRIIQKMFLKIFILLIHYSILEILFGYIFESVQILFQDIACVYM